MERRLRRNFHGQHPLSWSYAFAVPLMVTFARLKEAPQLTRAASLPRPTPVATPLMVTQAQSREHLSLHGTFLLLVTSLDVPLIVTWTQLKGTLRQSWAPS